MTHASLTRAYAGNMLNKLKKKMLRTLGLPEKAEGEKGIKALGHREYVGGKWDEIGRLQYDFLVRQGLKPSDCLLDIACGSLRAGVHFIEYLDAGNYLGIDKEQKLIELGIERELGQKRYSEKRPEFVVSDSFEFSKFSRKPQFAIANSLFTHLSPEDVVLCLKKLFDFVEDGHVLFATFHEGTASGNPGRSHSHVDFIYSSGEMIRMGEKSGWRSEYIGGWGHPRNQMMMKYTKVSA